MTITPSENDTRTTILILREFNWSTRQIARFIGRHPRSVSRFLTEWRRLDRSGW